ITPPAALLFLFVRRAAEVTCTSERVLKKYVLHSRRHNKRVETPQGVWVLWRCGRTEDTSLGTNATVRYVKAGIGIATIQGCSQRRSGTFLDNGKKAHPARSANLTKEIIQKQ